MKSSLTHTALAVLSRLDWLNEGTPDLAQALLTHGRLVHLQSGEWAQAEGDDRAGLYIVIAGQFDSYCQSRGDRHVLIGQSGPGAVLGHATRFSGGPRLVTAVCIEDATLLEISETALEQLASRYPEIWPAIASFTYQNMRRAVRMAAELLSLPPRQRLASRLLANAATATPNEPIIVPTSQHALAEMIGVSRKTVNRILADMEKAGLIETGYGKITLTNTAGLTHLADS